MPSRFSGRWIAFFDVAMSNVAIYLSGWNRIKQEPGRATTKNMREFIEHLSLVEIPQ